MDFSVNRSIRQVFELLQEEEERKQQHDDPEEHASDEFDHMIPEDEGADIFTGMSVREIASFGQNIPNQQNKKRKLDADQGASRSAKQAKSDPVISAATLHQMKTKHLTKDGKKTNSSHNSKSPQPTTQAVRSMPVLDKPLKEIDKLTQRQILDNNPDFHIPWKELDKETQQLILTKKILNPGRDQVDG